MTDLAVADHPRFSLAARYSASPMQVAALVWIAAFLIAFLIVPILRVIAAAFTGPDGTPSLVHFGDFLHTALLREAFWNSIYVGAMTVVVASLFAVPLATILARFRFRGAALIHTLGVVPLVMPPFVGAVAMQLIYGRNGAINLLLNDWFGFRIPFMEGLNGVIFVEALHYFPFILLNLSASLANIDSSMEESAQNLGASGLTLFSRIVFPLALPGYVAGAALVFVKVFDDLATPLLLNVNVMLAPQAYLKITSVGVADPMGYVISVIMIICSVAGLGIAGLALKGRDFATQQRGGGGLARRTLGPWGTAAAAAFVIVTLATVLSPHIGIFLLSIAHRLVVRGAAGRLHARPLRDGDARGRPVHHQHRSLLRPCRPDRRRVRRHHRLYRPAHAPARPPPGRAGGDVGGRDPRPRARHRPPAHLLRRSAADHRRAVGDVLGHAGDRLCGAPPALCAVLRQGRPASAPCQPGRGGGKPRRRQVHHPDADRRAARRPAD